MTAEVIDLQAARQHRAARLAARRVIVERANQFRLVRGRYVRSTVRQAWLDQHQPPMLTMRHLQLAVSICRAYGLVPDEVYVDAGFRPGVGTPFRAPSRRERVASWLHRRDEAA